MAEDLELEHHPLIVEKVKIAFAYDGCLEERGDVRDLLNTLLRTGTIIPYLIAFGSDESPYNTQVRNLATSLQIPQENIFFEYHNLVSLVNSNEIKIYLDVMNTRIQMVKVNCTNCTTYSALDNVKRQHLNATFYIPFFYNIEAKIAEILKQEGED